MSKVSATVYAEPGVIRRRTYKALQQARIGHDRAMTAVAWLRKQAWAGHTLLSPPPKDDPRLKLAWEIETKNAIPPLALLSHARGNGCGRLVTNCTCLDAQGKPLDWAESGQIQAGGLPDPTAPLAAHSRTLS